MIQLNPSRQDAAALEIRFTDTATIAGYACMASCTGAYIDGLGGYTRGNTIYLDRYQPSSSKKEALRHELGHYFFGRGHPKTPIDFLYGGVMDYNSLRVNESDQMHYRKLYGSSGQE